MEALIRELIPHAPHLGLYLAPDIPDRMLSRALSDYGGDLAGDQVVALYDATRLGTGGDGAAFAADRFAFQNNNFERGQMVRYSDVVGVRIKKRFLGGRFLEIDVNRGRATVPVKLDFSARADAATYVHRFLSEMVTTDPSSSPRANETDWNHVRATLDRLVREGRLSTDDRDAMLAGKP